LVGSVRVTVCVCEPHTQLVRTAAGFLGFFSVRIYRSVIDDLSCSRIYDQSIHCYLLLLSNLTRGSIHLQPFSTCTYSAVRTLSRFQLFLPPILHLLMCILASPPTSNTFFVNLLQILDFILPLKNRCG